MNKRTFGVAGLLIGILAVITGTYAIMVHSMILGAGYLLLSLFSGVLITRFFCIKCPIKQECVHLFPGVIARLWDEKKGSYTSGEMLITCLLFVIIILPPQVFLIRLPELFALFWVCIGIAAVCSHRFLCPGCGNTYCPFCRKRKK